MPFGRAQISNLSRVKNEKIPHRLVLHLGL
jgi:hypothetical protein